MPTITPIKEFVGTHRMGTLETSEQTIHSVLGEPTDVDCDNVEKIWVFRDEKGREAALWCFKIPASMCKHWSVWGDFDLIHELFGKTVTVY